MTQKADKLLYLYPQLSTFIQKDIDLLGKHFKLISRGFSDNKTLVPINLIAQFFFLIIQIHKTKTTICRFAGYHTLLPVILGKFFRKNVFIILGGTECHSFPSIRYGTQSKGFYRHIINFSLRNATRLLPVHESLMQCMYEYDPSGEPMQGCLVFCKNLKTPFTVIHNGYDQNRFHPTNLERAPNTLITVASTLDGAEFYRKGIDLIIETAKTMPHCRFTVIGGAEKPKFQYTSNVRILPKIPNDQLNDLLNEHCFYLQLSLAEGFPNALCEAMLAGCIPIGSDTFGIPDIIGDTGFILKRKSVQGLSQIINQALALDIHLLSKNATERILTHFPLQLRENLLLETIKSPQNNQITKRRTPDGREY